MISRGSSLNELKEVVKECLSDLYAEEGQILERNHGKGVCERTIVFRLAHHLQNKIPNYFVDCDFNSSFEEHINSERTIVVTARNGKPIRNVDESETKRFIDIIVHKRDENEENDLICFEIKKWNNKDREEFAKDENNLRVLTSIYNYASGFHITIHKVKARSTWTIFKDGDVFEPETNIFGG